MEAWAASALELLLHSPGVAVECTFILSRQQPRQAANGRAFFFRVYDRWRASSGRFLQSVPVGTFTRGLKTFELEGPRELSASDRALIENQKLDVLVHLGRSRLAGDCSKAAGCGVYSFAFGSPERTRRDPPYFWEVYEKAPVSSVCLLSHSHRWERARAIHRYEAATRQGWFYRKNQAEPFSQAGAMLERHLSDIQNRGNAAAGVPNDGEEIVVPDAGNAGPSNVQTALFLARQAARSLQLRLQARGRSSAWFIALREAKPGCSLEDAAFPSSGFTEIPHPKGNPCADPFLIHWQGRDFIFFEEIHPKTGRGRIAAVEIFKPGEYSAPFVVLERPYHLSYPFLTRVGEEIFMIPESCENGTVELYRAERFPDVWRQEKVLAEGVSLVDTTPFHYEGRWYFFTAPFDLANESCPELFLFHSDRLDGGWMWHPRNPICTGVRRTRPAGAIFRRQGKWIRPAQDCSVRYGYAMVLNEIVRLSETEYEERPVESIPPDWASGLLGTHTLNSAGRYEVIDGLRYAGKV